RRSMIDGKPYTVVGVLPAGIYYPTPETNIYIPLVLAPKEILRGAGFLRVLGRLKPGVTIESARADLDIVAARMAEQYPAENKGVGYNVLSMHEQVVGPIK